jgi:Family of unknown function (DUF5691)
MTPVDDPGIEALMRSFLLGTARHPVPAGGPLKHLIAMRDSPSELTALALLGQRLRFRRPTPLPERSAASPIEDPRQIVPDAARVLMCRLVDSKRGSATDVAALALADACDRGRLRPHPFDLPRMGAFARTHGDHLGAYAAAWAARGERAQERPGDYFDADAIDEANWTSARPAARAGFIAAMRAREPDRARALVEANFAADPAPVRARLIDALAPGLSAADTAFLESLAKDRAPSVREGAQRLLDRIPGTASAQGRLRDLVNRTKVSTSGLLRRRKVLALELPANLQQVSNPTSAITAARRWAVDSYAGVGLDAMAAAFDLSCAEMIAGASGDAALLALFARQASLERRFDLLAGIVREHAVDAWTDAIGTSAGGIPDIHEDAVIEQWCKAALAPELWPILPGSTDLDRLYRFLRRPLPLPQAVGLLRSQAFASRASEGSPAGVFGMSCLAIAALMPASLRSELRSALTSHPPEDTSRVTLFLDCLELLDPPEPASRET